MGKIRAFFTGILLFCAYYAIFAQEKGYLEFYGRCVKDHQPVKGANVSIYKGSTKVTEATTGKNGKFQFYLDFGVDYKITFTYPGCADMYLMIYASKCEENKSIFPIYDVADINFFEYGRPDINYEIFRTPLTKISYDGKKTFRDDEAYITDFIEKLFIDPEQIKKRDALIAEQKQKELEAKLKREAEEKQRLEQLAEAERQAQEEAERLKRQEEAKAKMVEPVNEIKTPVAVKENESKQSMATEEIELTIEKEKRNIKEKQNKAIKASYENDLLKIVATNERQQKEAQFKKEKEKVAVNEVIETLKKEAEVKAMSEQVLFDAKTRNKQAILNSRTKSQEMLLLIKQKAYNERNTSYTSVKKFPDVKAYKPAGLTAISSDIEHETFKTIYTYNISVGNNKTTYKKETYSWGVTYYYKNNVQVTEEQYVKEISPYNITL